MGDIGEMYNDHRQERKAKKLSNKEQSTKLISDLFYYESKNNGNHLVVENNQMVADFWPSTGKFNIRGESEYGRGVKKLIKILQAGK